MQVSQQRVDARQGMDAMRQMLARGESVNVTVTGHSMAPLLRHLKDGVTVAALRYWPPEINDIVFCQRLDGSPVMHRVFKIDGDVIWINGDAQTWEEPVVKEQVIGLVTYIRRGARQFSVFARWVRAYARVWRWLRPLRGFGFNVYRRIKGLSVAARVSSGTEKES